MTAKSKTAKSRVTRPPIMPVKIHKPKVRPPHVHDWKIFINHMSEAPEGQRCACGAKEWF
jgi:hypothetical protein